MAESPVTLTKCIRRLDGAQLLIDNLLICKRKALMFSSEFEEELHPEKTLAKCWRYAQDLVHDYDTGMGSAPTASFWCQKGREILTEIATLLAKFIEHCAHSLGIVGDPSVSKGISLAPAVFTVEECRNRLAVVGNFAGEMANVLGALLEGAEKLKRVYQVEMDRLGTRL